MRLLLLVYLVLKYFKFEMITRVHENAYNQYNGLILLMDDLPKA